MDVEDDPGEVAEEEDDDDAEEDGGQIHLGGLLLVVLARALVRHADAPGREILAFQRVKEFLLFRGLKNSCFSEGFKEGLQCCSVIQWSGQVWPFEERLLV